MYYDSKIDKDRVVVVDALSGSLNVSRVTTNNFSDHSRTIINFHKYGFLGLYDLDIDITLKNKDKISYDPTATIFVVVYGVSGHQNDVDTRIWDRIYYVENQTVKFEADVDMNDHDLMNINISLNNNLNMGNNRIKAIQEKPANVVYTRPVSGPCLIHLVSLNSTASITGRGIHFASLFCFIFVLLASLN